MKSVKPARLLICIIIAAMFQACVHGPPVRVAETEEPAIRPGDYANKTRELESLLENSPGNKERIKAHLALAAIYRSWDNPGRDYDKALHHLGRYASLVPEKERPPGITDWMAALAERDREIRGLSGKLKSLNDENSRLKSDKDKLEEETGKLRETIESLKHLDVQVEEKRRSFK